MSTQAAGRARRWTRRANDPMARRRAAAELTPEELAGALDAPCEACGARLLTSAQGEIVTSIARRYEHGFGDLETAADDVATLLGILEGAYA
jgi:hypothetical protein